MTVAELEAAADSMELAEWMAFDRISPLDLGACMAPAAIFNAMGVKAAGGKSRIWRPRDFLSWLRTEEEAEEAETDEIARGMQAWAIAMGGKKG